jgi:hypothetical protein
MQTQTQMTRHRDGRLWAIAFGLSLALNAVIILIFGFIALKSETFRKTPPPITAVPAETTVTIFPNQIEHLQKPQSPSSAPMTASKPRFANTADDQTAASPEKPAFIGERNTQATSDQKPDLTAPALPSQSGITPKSPDDFETTNSSYQDGDLADEQTAKPPESTPVEQTPPTPASELNENPPSVEKAKIPENDDVAVSPASREKLLNGPNPVDVAVPQEVPQKSAIKPSPEKRPQEERPATKAAQMPKPTTPKPTTEPAFRGNQKKTAIVGSISRNGRSALDVVDSPLGRYQAIVSRAVEQEWQRNCVRHRDFITPGFLTVQFFVESSGKVRTVRFVGEMETGEVQKGFTLNAIRDAEIPPMPAAVKKEFSKEPLELIFNFYF